MGEQIPEVWETCPDCCGEGSIEKPQSFADDPYFCVVTNCETCHGAGGAICEAKGTRISRPARLFIEAFCGLNDTFPGDPYP
jgi:DnaJ-class molecular chaperone